MRTTTGVVFGILVVGCASAPGDDDAGSRDQALLADFARCDRGHLTSTLASVCRYPSSTSYYAAVVTLASPDALLAAAPTVLEGGRYGLHFRPGSGGKVQFRPRVSGNYVFYLGTPNVPFALSSDTDENVTPLCSIYLSDELKQTLGSPDCPREKGAYVARLEGNRTYLLNFGALQPLRFEVTLFILKSRTLLPAASSVCTYSESTAFRAPLTELCGLAGSETPVNGGLLRSSDVPELEPSKAYGVHLAPTTHEAALEFTPPHTGYYLVGFGTPSLPVSLLLPTARTQCVAKPETLGSVDACKFRDVRQVWLQQGAPLRIEFQGSDSQRWVRVGVVAAEPDSDGDGQADSIDVCPNDAFKVTDPGYCGCGVPEPAVCPNLKLLFLSEPDRWNTGLFAGSVASLLTTLQGRAENIGMGALSFASDPNPTPLSTVPITADAALLRDSYVMLDYNRLSLDRLLYVAHHAQSYGFGAEGGYVALPLARALRQNQYCSDCRGIEIICTPTTPSCEEGNCDDVTEECNPVTPCPPCFPNNDDDVQEEGEQYPDMPQLKRALENANLVPVFLTPYFNRDAGSLLTGELGRGGVATYDPYSGAPLAEQLKSSLPFGLGAACHCEGTE